MQQADVERLLDGAGGARVVVVGDAMLDVYTIGKVDRISPEAPVPVVEITGRQCSPGGAANAAVCVAALGPATTLCGTVGDDESGSELVALLARRGVVTGLAACADEPTITKHRVWADGQQLIRLDTEQYPEPGRALGRLRHELIFDDVDAVLLSDYGKGVLDAETCPWIIDECRGRGIPVVVDPKSSDFSRYAGATVVKPNEREARSAFATRHGRSGTIEEIGMYLAAEVATHVAITRGANGIDYFHDGRHVHVPVHQQTVFDVTGAGDVAAAVLTTCVAIGRDLVESCRLANAAARISVSRVGTGAVTHADLTRNTDPDE